MMYSLISLTFFLFVTLSVTLASYVAVLIYVQNFVTVMLRGTRKLCYRKDDRAMRPIYGCRENLRDSLTTDYSKRMSIVATNVKNGSDY